MFWHALSLTINNNSTTTAYNRRHTSFWLVHEVYFHTAAIGNYSPFVLCHHAGETDCDHMQELGLLISCSVCVILIEQTTLCVTVFVAVFHSWVFCDHLCGKGCFCPYCHSIFLLVLMHLFHLYWVCRWVEFWFISPCTTDFAMLGNSTREHQAAWWCTHCKCRQRCCKAA